jgi:hypothetical protein
MFVLLRHYIATWPTPVVVLGGFILSVLVLMPSPISAAPTIRWTSALISETVTTGESRTRSISFTASQNTRNVVVQVSLELQPFIRIEPASLSRLAKEQLVEISVIISAPSSTPITVSTGTIQLKSAGEPAKIFASPLPVVVKFQPPLINHQKVPSILGAD